MKAHWTDRLAPYIFYGVLALIVIGWVAFAYFAVTSHDKPCSYFDNAPAKYIPARCLKEFGITPIIVPR